MLRALSNVADLSVRARAIADRLDRSVLEELDRIVRGASGGSTADRGVLIALVRARVGGDLGSDTVEALCAEARLRELLAAESVLRHEGAHRAIRGRLPEPLIPARSVAALRYAPSPRFTRAGFRLATAPVRERLLRDPRPEVVHQLLDLPSTTRPDVLRLASRRPTTAPIARAIAASRWLCDLAVREALVRNPFVETWLALMLLPTVRRSVLSGAPLDRELTRMAGILRGSR